MWVRSQDKELLVQITSAWIRKFTTGINEIMVETSNATFKAGQYSTKEQYLQVLDDIEERINEGCPFVYQMPEDGGLVKNLKVDDETVAYVLRCLLNSGFDIQHTGNKIIDNVINKINEEE